MPRSPISPFEDRSFPARPTASVPRSDGPLWGSMSTIATPPPHAPLRFSSMDWLGKLYARRIINVNVNIIVAGLAAMLLTLLPVHATRYMGIESKWVIIGVTLGFDLAFDVAIFYVLHWLANHMQTMPWSRHREVPPIAGMTYFRDATLVQFERAMLGPVYYGVAVVVQYSLLYTLDRELAALVGLCSGLAATRFLHTLWMLRTERRRILQRMAEISRCATCGAALGMAAAQCPRCSPGDAQHRPPGGSPMPESMSAGQ